MRLGVCTTDFQTMPADALFAQMRGFGFDCVQLAFDTVSETGFRADGACEIPDGVSDAALTAIREASEKYRLPITCVNGTFNMAHPDEAVRKMCLSRFPRFAASARKTGATLVSLCSGTRNRESLWKTHEDNASPEAWDDMLEGMLFVSRAARAEGLTLAIETEASNVLFSAERAARALREVGAPNLQMILDCANLFQAGTVKIENVRSTIQNAMDMFGDQVALAHGKDIRAGEGIDFCATGEGIVDFPFALSLLRAHGFRGDMMLHGIYDPALMPLAARRMRAWIAEDAARG